MADSVMEAAPKSKRLARVWLEVTSQTQRAAQGSGMSGRHQAAGASLRSHLSVALVEKVPRRQCRKTTIRPRSMPERSVR